MLGLWLATKFFIMIEELELIYDEFKSSNEKSLNHFESELIKIRAGKASPSMLQGVMVEYYGSMTPIQQVANVNTMDARTIVVQPWEKNMLNDIAKGIMNANLGLNPQNNGEQLLIAVPPLTEERRRDLVKRAKAEAENAKVGIRNHRKDSLDMIKDLKKDGLSEDMEKDAEEEVQKITNSFIKKIEDLLEIKEKDIMTV
jgi:ribosome recycling factor